VPLKQAASSQPSAQHLPNAGCFDLVQDWGAPPLSVAPLWQLTNLRALNIASPPFASGLGFLLSQLTRMAQPLRALRLTLYADLAMLAEQWEVFEEHPQLLRSLEVSSLKLVLLACLQHMPKVNSSLVVPATLLMHRPKRARCAGAVSVLLHGKCTMEGGLDGCSPASMLRRGRELPARPAQCCGQQVPPALPLEGPLPCALPAGAAV
jgi:hypothetical protein